MSAEILEQARENKSKLQIEVDKLNKLVHDIEESGLEVGIWTKTVDSKDGRSMNTVLRFNVKLKL
jgi:hypothetical protein